jgi:hypothetical protein
VKHFHECFCLLVKGGINTELLIYVDDLRFCKADTPDRAVLPVNLPDMDSRAAAATGVTSSVGSPLHAATWQISQDEPAHCSGRDAADGTPHAATVGVWRTAQLCVLYGAICAHVLVMAYTDPVASPTFAMLLLLFRQAQRWGSQQACSF